MTQCIALIRGINVGRAKRIAMSDPLAKAKPLLQESWSPESFAIGATASR